MTQKIVYKLYYSKNMAPAHMMDFETPEQAEEALKIRIKSDAETHIRNGWPYKTSFNIMKETTTTETDTDGNITKQTIEKELYRRFQIDGIQAGINL